MEDEKEISYLEMDSKYAKDFYGVPSEINADVTPEEDTWYRGFKRREYLDSITEREYERLQYSPIMRVVKDGIDFTSMAFEEGKKYLQDALTDVLFDYKISDTEEIIKRRQVIKARREQAHRIHQFNLQYDGLGDEMYEEILKEQYNQRHSIRPTEEDSLLEKAIKQVYDPQAPYSSGVQLTTALTDIAAIASTGMIASKVVPLTASAINALEYSIPNALESALSIPGLSSTISGGVKLGTLASAIGMTSEYANALNERKELYDRILAKDDRKVLLSEDLPPEPSMPVLELIAVSFLASGITSKAMGKIAGRFRFNKTLKEALANLPEESTLEKAFSSSKSYAKLTGKSMTSTIQEGKNFDDWLKISGLEGIADTSNEYNILKTTFDTYNRKLKGGILDKYVYPNLSPMRNYGDASKGALELPSAKLFTKGSMITYPMMGSYIGRGVYNAVSSESPVEPTVPKTFIDLEVPEEENSYWEEGRMRKRN